MARLRNAPGSGALATTNSREALKEKTNTTRSKAPAYEDAEHLIKDTKPKRGRPKKKQQESDELVMGGGLGQRDELAPTSEALATTDELAKSDEAPPPTAHGNRRPPRAARKVVRNEAQSKVMEDMKKRMEGTARGQKAKQTAPAASDNAQPSSDTIIVAKAAPRKSNASNVERSEFSLSPSPPPPGKLSTVKGPRSSMAQPGSVLRAHATPAMETSMLAIRNFKRRPRQPSMLQMVQQRTASASARPSIAHTGVNSTAVEDPSVFDLDISDDEEDDFSPEAEGTPLNVAKTKRASASAKNTASAKSKVAEPKATRASKKRKSDEIDDSMESLTSKQAKRRKSEKVVEPPDDPLPAPVTQVPATQTSSDRAETPQPPVTSDVQVINSPSTSTPPTEPPSVVNDQAESKEDDFVVPSTEREEQQDHVEVEEDEDNIIVNGTMAEPLSSSPPRDDPLHDDVFADPATQASPPAARKKKEKKAKPMLTSTLQSLLPKRRQPLKTRHRKSEYDFESDSDQDEPVDTSHLDEDEDELGGRQRQRQTKTASKNAPAKRGRGRPSKAAASTTKKTTTAPTRKSSAAPKKGLRTYGRAATSDKENDEYESAAEEEEGESTLPEVSISMEEATKTKELEDAKKRFADVDDWDMEFESYSAEAHRSSSPRWR